ncbi:MAG TPA: TonB-dependent receptor [Novosphingobium sp.]|nr:TonB-dependent receptor [Novosphingobium sp.]
MARRAFLIPVFLALAARPALAEERPKDDGEIVVTGRGLDPSPLLAAYSAITLERDRGAASASGRLDDVLGQFAGVQQFRRSDSRSANPTAQGVTLRGLGGNASSRTLMLLDGVPVTDPFFGHVPFSALPFERLDRATLIRGGGSGAFGAGAVAGTLDLVSANPAGLPLAELALTGNDRGESELSGTVAPQLGNGYAVVSGRWDRGQGFWTTPQTQRVAASARAAFDSWSTSARAVVPVNGDIELQTRLLVFDDNRTLRFQSADSHQNGEDASLRLVGRGAWQFDLIGYVQARDFSNVVISSTSFRKTLDQRTTPSTGLGGKLELRPPIDADHSLRVGIDWRRASGEMQEIAYSGATGAITARRRAGGVNDDLGFYLEHDRAFGPLRLTGTARLDRWAVREGHFIETNAAGAVTTDNRFADRAGWDLSLRGGTLIALTEGLSLRGSLYNGLRQPTLNELYRPFVVFPVTTRANAALKNEELFGFEAGFDFKRGGFELQATAFDNRVRDAIANVTIGANLRQRQNVDAVRSRGIELCGKVNLGRISWDGTLSLIDARVEGSGASAALDGKRPAQVPAFTASTTLSWRPARGWLFAAKLRHSSAQFEDDLETDRLAPVTTLDALITVPLSPWATLVLRAENLTDAEVVTRNQAGSLDLGAPRTLWAGLRFSIGR